MIPFRYVLVSLMPLCILLSIVGGHSKDIVEQHGDIRTKRVARKGFQFCDKDKECVPSFEYCDTKLESTEIGMHRCGLIRQKSWNLQSFCCPVKQITSIWRSRRMYFDVEQFAPVNDQEKKLELTVKPSQKIAQNLIIKLYLEEAMKLKTKPSQEGALNSTLTPLQKIALKIIKKASQGENRERTIKLSHEEVFNPTIIPVEVEELISTITPLLEGELIPTVSPSQEKEEEEEEEEDPKPTISSLQGEVMKSTVYPLNEEEELKSTITPFQEEVLDHTVSALQKEKDLQPNFTLSQEEVQDSTINPLQEKEELEPTFTPSKEIQDFTINPLYEIEKLDLTITPLRDEEFDPTISPLQKEKLNNTIKLYNFTEEQECGFNNISMIDKVLYQNSNPDDWPWMAVFLLARNYLNFCGGVLINRQFVLTAAHCFKGTTIEQIILRLGEYDFSTNNDTKYIDYQLSDIILHPAYAKVTQKNDIALVKLNKPTEYNAFIRPICLPKPDMRVYGRLAIVIGWGQTVYGGTLSDVLREVTVPIWHSKECKMAFLQKIYDTNICAAAYEGGRDSCLGDSGGPLLVQRNDGRWTNVGIVSWGIKCGQPGKPGVYTLVTSYLQWIIENSKV